MTNSEMQDLIKYRLKELQKGQYSEIMILCQLMQEIAQRISTIDKNRQ